MRLRAFLGALLLPCIAAASPVLQNRAEKPAAFFLAGDSTTAVQSSGGGGWGNGFLKTLKSPSYGVNKGHNGATTVSFVQGGDWKQVLDLVKKATSTYEVYVTIQFGHNDQKSDKGISMNQFKTNLKNMAKDVQKLGATPLLLTSLTRRKFSGNTLSQDLADVVPATQKAASEAGVTLIDLNAASRKYVQAIGQANADKFNLKSGDRTHLNAHGSDVFGRIVADLIVASKKNLAGRIREDAALSRAIARGVYV